MASFISADKPSKKTTITFAIDEKVLAAVKHEADETKVSVNARINNILAKYASFWRYVEMEGSIIFASRIMPFILENIDEEKWVQEYRRVILDLVSALLMEIDIAATLENTIRFLFGHALLNCRAYDGFSYRLDEEGCLNLVFRHKLGLKWSRIIGIVYPEFIENNVGYRTKTTVTETGIVIKIIEKNTGEIERLMQAKQ